MTTDKLKNETMLRIRNKDLLDKLQSLYDLSKCKSANEFYNALLNSIAFHQRDIEEILDKLDDILDNSSAILEKLNEHK
ncbi:MAG: hypothetical protein ACI4L1_00395 [Christensenellales bacterium]